MYSCVCVAWGAFVFILISYELFRFTADFSNVLKVEGVKPLRAVCDLELL